MKTLLIIFILTLKLNIQGQEYVCGTPSDTTCGRQFDTISKTYFYSTPDKPAKYNGEFIELAKFISKNLILPDSCEIHKIFALIIVKADGTTSFLKLAKPSDCDKLEIAVKNCIESMPKWIPAECKQKPVDHRFILPISIRTK